ncbi:MAG: M1 family metallopeptidase [Bacteroidales bacterium]|nr:M1 family metallopeptidase [Bacteroidales bacterium]
MDLTFEKMKKHFTAIIIIICFSNIIFAQNKDFRNNIDVLHYSINLDITNFINREISGNTVVKLSPVKKDITEIQLDLLKMEIDSVFLFNEKVTDYKYDGKYIIIPYKPEVSDGECCTQLNIYYHGHPVQDASWGGFFFSDSTAYNIGVGMAAEPHSFGRVWFPCIDSFTDKATYNYNIKVPEGYKAVCSGVLESETKNEDKTVTFSWSLKQEVPTYLVSVAVAKYDIVEDIYKGIKRDIPISLYVYPEDYENAVYSFQNLKKALASFEKGYGEYVWDRVGYVEVPFTSGAMEHVCNIAYPEYAFDSTLFRETLMAHELSHHWFGNLVTCRTSGDMWLNEGWASFSEALFKEDVYGKEAYKEYVRENHIKVLTQAHIRDNGYRAVYGVPHDYTYGTTVYDKGADVAHTLRDYMGDSLFFNSLTAYMKAFSYRAADTYEFRDFMSKHSGVDLIPFFDTWVFEKGFPHFSINSFNVEKIKTEYKAEVIIAQRLVARDFYGEQNKINLTFVDENLGFHKKRAVMSGPSETLNFFLSSKPVAVLIDAEEQISDATVDNYKIFTKPETYNFPYTDFSIIFSKLKEKAVVQSIVNFIKPEYKNIEGYKLSDVQYWEIRGAATDKYSAEGSFFASMTENNFDEFFDEAVFLYRPNVYTKFEEIDTKSTEINEFEGILTVKNFKFGQYVLAVKK